MQITITKNNFKIQYDERYVYIADTKYVHYSKHNVYKLSPQYHIGIIYQSDNVIYALYEFNQTTKFYCNESDNTIRNISSHEIVAIYEENPFGALAAYVTYLHILHHGHKRTNVTDIRNSYDTPDRRPIRPSPVKDEEKNIKLKPKTLPVKEPPTPEQFTETRPQRLDSHVNDRYPNKPTIHSVPSVNGSSCLGIIIAIIIIVVAISLIPESWKDLKTYIPDGDIGITICFFSSIIAGIIALIAAIISKGPKFTQCMSIFLSICGIGIGINAIILLKDIFAGTYTFTGFILFDIPLAIFAPILGCFQFAFPIGIGVAIICGIICMIKSQD